MFIYVFILFAAIVQEATGNCETLWSVYLSSQQPVIVIVITTLAKMVGLNWLILFMYVFGLAAVLDRKKRDKVQGALTTKFNHGC